MTIAPSSRPPSPRGVLILCTLTVILALVLGCAAARAATQNFCWYEFEPNGGRMVVEMPGEPKLYTEAEQTPVGSIDTYRYIWRKDGMTFAAAYADVPGLIALFAGRQTIYDKVKDAFLKRAHMSEIAYTNFKQDAYTGVALTFGNEKTYGKLRMLLVSRRVYFMAAQVPRDMKDKSAIDRFLASFKPIYRKARQLHGRRR